MNQRISFLNCAAILLMIGICSSQPEVSVVSSDYSVHVTDLKAIPVRGFQLLHYQLQLPNQQWSSRPVTIPRSCSTLTPNATSDEGRRRARRCDFMNLTAVFINEFSRSMQLFQKSILFSEDNFRRSKRGLIDGIGKVGEWLFGIAAEDEVRSLRASEKMLADRLRSLRFNVDKSLHDETFIVTELNSWSDNLTDAFAGMRNQSRLYMNSISTSYDDIALELQHASSMAFTSLSELVKLSHAMKVSSILSDCAKGQIPTQAIEPSKFVQDLARLEEKLKGKDLQFSYSPLEAAKHSNGHQCKCLISKSQIHLEVRIPIMLSSDSIMHFRKVEPLYFSWEGEQCRLIKEPYIVEFKSVTDYEITVIAGDAMKDCMASWLCVFLTFVAGDVPIHCISAVIRSAEISKIQKECHFFCEKYPTIVRVSSTPPNAYVISGGGRDVTVLCANSKKTFSTPKTGALSLSVLCSCRITAERQTIVSATTPCVQDDSSANSMLSATNILLPALWLQSDKAEDAVEFALDEHRNISSLLNPSWKNNIPHLTFPAPTRSLPDDFWNLPTFNESWFSVIWKVVLSLLVVLALYTAFKSFTKLRSFINQVLGVASAMRSESHHGTDGSGIPLQEREHQ